MLHQPQFRAGLSGLLFTLLLTSAATGTAQELNKPRLDLGLPATATSDTPARAATQPANPLAPAFDVPTPSGHQTSQICRDGSRSTTYLITEARPSYKCDEVMREGREPPFAPDRFR